MEIKYKFLDTSNFMKAFLMILVVLQHATALWAGWFNQKPNFPSIYIKYFSEIISSFHIYAFILVSGYIYAYLKYEKNKYVDFIFFIKNKFKRLIIPYIFISLFWVMPFHIYFFKENIKEVLIKFILGILPSQLWFLLMLFNIFFIIYFIGNIIYSSYLKGFCVCIIIYVIGIILGQFFNNIYQILGAFNYLIYFIIGMYIYKSNLYILKKIPSYIYILIFYFLQFAKYKLPFFVNTPILNKLYNLGLQKIISVEGAIMIFIILGRIGYRLKRSKYNYENYNLYKFLQKYNFIIYLFHQQIICCVIILLNKKVSSFVLVNANFFISVFLSSIIILILRKINFIKKILNL